MHLAWLIASPFFETKFDSVKKMSSAIWAFSRKMNLTIGLVFTVGLWCGEKFQLIGFEFRAGFSTVGSMGSNRHEIPASSAEVDLADWATSRDCVEPSYLWVHTRNLHYCGMYVVFVDISIVCVSSHGLGQDCRLETDQSPMDLAKYSTQKSGAEQKIDSR